MRMVSTNGRSLGELLKHLKESGTRLFRQEVALVKAEMKETASRAAQDASLIVAGGVVALLGAMAIVAALSIALSVVLALMLPDLVAVWLGPLIVGAALAAAAWGLVQSGRRKLRQRDFTPQKTRETMVENKEWIREKVS